MKYLLLAGDTYYPTGSDDIVGVFETVGAATVALNGLGRPFDWWEIFDLDSLEVVERS